MSWGLVCGNRLREMLRNKVVTSHTLDMTARVGEMKLPNFSFDETKKIQMPVASRRRRSHHAGVPIQYALSQYAHSHLSQTCSPALPGVHLCPLQT